MSRLLVLCLALLVIGCAKTTGLAVDGVAVLPVLDPPQRIDGQWKVAFTDNAAFKDPGFDDAAWELVKVPRGLGLQEHRDHSGVYWYRLKIVLPPAADLSTTQLGLRLGQCDSAVEVYVDGLLVGSTGRVPRTSDDEGFVDHDHTTIVSVPPGAIVDHEVVVALRGWRSPVRASSNPARGGITHGPLIVGDTSTVARQALFDELDDICLVAVFFTVGLYHLNLWWRRREQASYLWFGVFSLQIGIYILCSREISFLFLGSLLRNKIGFAAVFTCFPVFIQFLWPFLGVPIRWWWRVEQGLAITYFAISTLWPSLWFTQKFFIVFTVLVLLPSIFGLLALIVRQAWQKNPEARTILVGGVALFATAINNVGIERNLWQAPEITNICFGIFVLSMALSLSNRFTRVYGELDEKNAELTRMDKLKDEFLANTSHELRTPLNGILGITEGLVDNDKIKEETRIVDDLRMILTSGHRLSSLINDILDFSKLREGKLEMNLVAVDVRPLVDVVLRLLGPLAARKGLGLKNEVPVDLPAVMADENRLQQILVNLVGNALKFTEKGSVSVGAVVVEGSLQLNVDDTGIGIAPEDQARVFNAFEQAAGSTARVYGGTGLGLSITRQLVALHHGKLSMTSTLGQGSRFTVTLPLAGAGAVASLAPHVVDVVAAPLLAAHPVISDDVDTEVSGSNPRRPGHEIDGRKGFMAGMRVLVVDDEPINIRVLESHLTSRHFEVVQAGSGPEALRLLDGSWTPDLVLLDVMMPKMSGYEVCQKIRERYPAHQLPIVLVTAKDRVVDIVAGFDVGASDYVTKPVSKGELLARIQTHLRLAKVNAATNRFVPFEFLSMLGKESVVEIDRGDQVQRQMSILFSDIRSFTSIVEKSTAAESFRFINTYLACMEPAIKAHRGFVDNFIGDAIMALFDGSGVDGNDNGGGAQDAVDAGIGMHRALPAYNVDRIAKGLLPVRIGIGVQTGVLTAGTLGGEHHIKCTVIGDPVNTASRIEGMTKMYGARFLIGEATRDALPPGRFSLRTVDRVTPKGKNVPTTIYEVLDAEDAPVFDRRLKSLSRFEEALRLYYARNFADARKLLTELKAVDDDDVLLGVYLSRCDAFVAAPPGPDWDGVINLKSK
ncbi:MAG: ATP-binding protein [Deltaproteobacteria bacterium]|nr:ATP-binding protein [Deltaproteobacteria bacterium]